MAVYGATKQLTRIAKRQIARVARKAPGRENAAYRRHYRTRIERAARKLSINKREAMSDKSISRFINKSDSSAVLRSKDLRKMINEGGFFHNRGTLNSLHREAMLQGDAKATKEITSAMLRMQRKRLKTTGEIWGGGFAVKASKKQLALWNKQLR